MRVQIDIKRHFSNVKKLQKLQSYKVEKLKGRYLFASLPYLTIQRFNVSTFLLDQLFNENACFGFVFFRNAIELMVVQAAIIP